MERRSYVKATRNSPAVHGRGLLGNKNVAEDFEVRSVSTAKESYPPGADVTVTVEFGGTIEGALLPAQVNMDHPDVCEPGFFKDTIGADLVPSVSVEGGTAATGSGNCWDYNNTDSIFKTFTVSAPVSAGPADIVGEVRGTQSGQVYGSATKQILVNEQVSGEGDRTDGNQNNNDSQTENCGFIAGLLGKCQSQGGQGGSVLGTKQTIALAAFTVLVLVSLSAAQ